MLNFIEKYLNQKIPTEQKKTSLVIVFLNFLFI